MHPYDAAEVVTERGASLSALLVVGAATNDDPRIVSTVWRALVRVVEVTGYRARAAAIATAVRTYC